MKQLTNYCWRSWSLSSTGNGMTWYVRLLAVFLTKLCSSSFFYFAVWWVGSYARKTTVFICKLEQYPFLVLILGVLKYEVIHMVSISRCGGLYLEIQYGDVCVQEKHSLFSSYFQGLFKKETAYFKKCILRKRVERALSKGGSFNLAPDGSFRSHHLILLCHQTAFLTCFPKCSVILISDSL